MIDLARGFIAGFPSEAKSFSAASTLANESPSAPSPPTRRKSRRETPLQSRLKFPGREMSIISHLCTEEKLTAETPRRREENTEKPVAMLHDGGNLQRITGVSPVLTGQDTCDPR